MTYLPKSAWDIQQAVENGEVCAGCQTPFVAANGCPSHCRDCFSLARLSPDPDAAPRYPLTQHDDQDVHRGKIASRIQRAKHGKR